MSDDLDREIPAEQRENALGESTAADGLSRIPAYGESEAAATDDLPTDDLPEGDLTGAWVEALTVTPELAQPEVAQPEVAQPEVAQPDGDELRTEAPVAADAPAAADSTGPFPAFPPLVRRRARARRRGRRRRLVTAVAVIMLLAVVVSGTLIGVGWLSGRHAPPTTPTYGSASPQKVDEAAATAVAGAASDNWASEVPNHSRVKLGPFTSVMVLGDSVTEGYLLASPDQHYTVLLSRDLAQAGLLTSDAALRELGVPALSAAWADVWLADHPTTAATRLWNESRPADLVILQLGLNDWLHAASSRGDFTQGVTRLLHVLQSHSAPRAMLVCQTPWGGIPGSDWDGNVPDGAGITIPEYASMLVPLCLSVWDGPVVIVDMAPLIVDPTLHNHGQDQHPNAAGHVAIAQAIFDAMKRYIDDPHHWTRG